MIDNISLNTIRAFDTICGYFEKYTKLDANKTGFFLMFAGYMCEIAIGALSMMSHNYFMAFIFLGGGLLQVYRLKGIRMFINNNAYKTAMRMPNALKAHFLNIVFCLFFIVMFWLQAMSGNKTMINGLFICYIILDFVGTFFFISNPEPPKKREPKTSNIYQFSPTA